MLIVAAYLAANVAANLSVTYFGPISTPINAFLLIAFDLAARDKLHEEWSHKHLWPKMLLLVGSGALLSYFLNRDAGPIAIASFIAFLLTGLTDTVVYQALKKHPRIIKSNGSNIASAAVDSVAFPTLAFGTFIPYAVFGQFFAKVFGGYIWSLILFRKDRKKLKDELNTT
ncbi:MAG: VUT family protein [Desulfitobacterium sp.]|mgnify:CR=1 FL=1|nr:VUT family protein [Desulfitobacterium sp.]